MSFGFRLFFADKTVFVSAESLVGKEEGNKTIYAAEISGVQIVWCAST